tara:strand:- start:297 stop:470 length:174 start_codon:yes stop_codon:yes gene_type:complete
MTKTTIASVGKASNSVRTVIPMWIAELMKLGKGDKLDWTLMWDTDTQKHIIEVKKVE